MVYSPIVLFAYKRADKLKQCLEALEKNNDTEKSDIYIFCDGPKNEKEYQDVQEVRKYLTVYKQDSSFKKVEIIKNTVNKGLANSIIDGVTEVINIYGRVIVLEDDIITTNDFIRYMNGALEFYENFHQYGSISAYTLPIEGLKKYEKDVYVTRKGDCWGWGTWKNRWEKVDWAVSDFESYSKNKKIRKQFESLQTGIDHMLEMQVCGEIDSWAVRWCYFLFKNNLLTVYPKASRSFNIGVDGTGTHCGNISEIYKFEETEYSEQCRYEILGIDKKLEKEASLYERNMQFKRKIKLFFKLGEKYG